MKEGKIYKSDAPFLKIKDAHMDSSELWQGVGSREWWQHGMRFENEDGYGISSVGDADAQGEIEYKIVKIIPLDKPYRTRILYRKRLIDPDGKTLKWQPLEMCGEAAFSTRIEGRKWTYEVS